MGGAFLGTIFGLTVYFTDATAALLITENWFYTFLSAAWSARRSPAGFPHWSISSLQKKVKSSVLLLHLSSRRS